MQCPGQFTRSAFGPKTLSPRDYLWVKSNQVSGLFGFRPKVYWPRPYFLLLELLVSASRDLIWPQDSTTDQGQTCSLDFSPGTGCRSPTLMPARGASSAGLG